jgi:hypothetical protein
MKFSMIAVAALVGLASVSTTAATDSNPVPVAKSNGAAGSPPTNAGASPPKSEQQRLRGTADQNGKHEFWGGHLVGGSSFSGYPGFGWGGHYGRGR